MIDRGTQKLRFRRRLPEVDAASGKFRTNRSHRNPCDLPDGPTEPDALHIGLRKTPERKSCREQNHP